MAVSDELFKLIRSMGKSEKRYFQLYASLFTSRNKNVYVILFEQIEKQKEYNEPKVLRAFRLKGIKVDLPSLKVYLYDMILKCLKNYKTDHDIDEQIQSLISSAKLLHKKQLNVQAKKYLKKAKSMAEDNERFLLLLDIKRTESKYLHLYSEYEEIETTIEENFKEQFDIIDKLDNTAHYRYLNSRAYLIHSQSPYIRNQNQLDKFKKLLSDPYMDLKMAKTLFSQYAYHSIMGGFYHNIMDHENLYIHSKKQVELCLSSEVIMNVVHEMVMLGYANLINACILTGKQFEALKYLKEMNMYMERPMIINDLHIYTVYKQNAIFLELMLYVHFSDVPNGISLIKDKFEEVYSEDAPPFMKENEFLLYCIRAYMLSEDYKGAEDMLILLLNRPYSKGYSYFNSVSRFINLIVHFELKHFDFLDHLIVSCYRFVLKRKDSFKTEKELISLIRKSAAAVDKKEMIEVFKVSLENLNKLKEEQFERPAFAYFDYTIWLRSKIEGKSMLELSSETK